jgi:predicted transcriptional regulator
MIAMIEQLFGSKTRVKLLQLFYGNPNRSFYVREITRKIDEQINSVRRELANLLSIGIIVSDTTNNKLYYEVNQILRIFCAVARDLWWRSLKKPKGKIVTNRQRGPPANCEWIYGQRRHQVFG